MVAAKVTGQSEDQVTKDERSKAKPINFGKPGSMGSATLKDYARASYGITLADAGAELNGDRNPREHEFSIQLRAFDASNNGRALGVAVLLALSSALINKSLRGGLVVVGGINLGGSIDPLHNAIDVVELAVEKGASVVLMPVSARKQLFELSDDMATKVNVLYFTDAREAFIKALSD